MKPDFLSRAISALGPKVDVDVTKTTAFVALQTEFDEFKAEANSVVELQTAEIEKLKVENQELAARVAQLSTYAEAADAEKAKLVADAEAKRLAERNEKIVAAVGSEKAQALMTATQGLDDTAFDAVVSALGTSATAEAKSPLFNELGVSADVDASKIVTESKEMQMIRDKYNTPRD